MNAPAPMPLLPGGVTLVSDPLDQLVIATPQSRAVVHLQGAQVTSWQPTGESPVLFLSRAAEYVAGRPIRGGVPICFPWLGAGPTKDRRPSHGFARVRPWQLAEVREEAAAAVVVLELHDDDATREVWPHEFTARYEISVGRVLSLSLEVRNTGADPMTFEESLHSYFAVEDVARTRVDGLDGRPYVEGFRDARAPARQSGALRLTDATELVFRDDGEELTVVDEVRSRGIRLTSRRSRSTIVWNPGPEYVTSIRDMADDEWSRMLCVETANVGNEAVTLAPGETHTLGLEVAVAPAD